MTASAIRHTARRLALIACIAIVAVVTLAATVPGSVRLVNEPTFHGPHHTYAATYGLTFAAGEDANCTAALVGSRSILSCNTDASGFAI